MGFRHYLPLDFLVDMPLLVIKVDVSVDVNGLVWVQIVTILIHSHIFREHLWADTLLGDDFVDVTHRVTRDNEAIHAEHLYTTIRGKIHQCITCYQQVLEDFTG